MEWSVLGGLLMDRNRCWNCRVASVWNPEAAEANNKLAFHPVVSIAVPVHHLPDLYNPPNHLPAKLYIPDQPFACKSLHTPAALRWPHKNLQHSFFFNFNKLFYTQMVAPSSACFFLYVHPSELRTLGTQDLSKGEQHPQTDNAAVNRCPCCSLIQSRGLLPF